MPTEIWSSQSKSGKIRSSQLGSGSACWDLELAIDVLQCPLRSGGLAASIEIWNSEMRKQEKEEGGRGRKEGRRKGGRGKGEGKKVRGRKEEGRTREAIVKKKGPRLAVGKMLGGVADVDLLFGLCWVMLGFVEAEFGSDVRLLLG